ncbi:MAG TPA: hypothetical protein VNB24_05705 [Acidimicrobiales bacterium]|nr:hypothetical protein [Acidimicrobiales bacterium]
MTAPATTDWVTQVVDRLDGLIDLVRSKTTSPLAFLARVLVYGLLSAVMGVAALTLLTVMLVRVADIAIPEDVWLTYLILGGLFTVGGFYFWRRASSATRK